MVGSTTVDWAPSVAAAVAAADIVDVVVVGADIVDDAAAAGMVDAFADNVDDAVVRDFPVWSGWIVRVTTQQTCCSWPIPPWVVVVMMMMSMWSVLAKKNRGVKLGFVRELAPAIARK